MEQPGKSAGEAPGQADAPAIGRLADHLKMTTDDIQGWLRQQKDVPAQVLLSWIHLWDQRRPKS